MPNPGLTAAFDGDYNSPFQVGGLDITRPIANDASAQVVRQHLRVRASVFSPLALNTPGFQIYGQQTYLVEETEAKIDEFDCANWDRVFATKPNPRTDYVAGTKVFKRLNPVFNGSGVLVVDPLASWSAPVTVARNISYYVGRASGIAAGFPGVPDVLFINLGSIGTYVFGVGGFQVVNGSGSNFGVTFMGAEINRYMGDIWERVDIYALQ